VEIDQEKTNSEDSNSEKAEAEILEKNADPPISEKSDSGDSKDMLSKVSEKNELDDSDEESMASVKSRTTVYSIVPNDSWPNPSEIPPPIDNRQRQSIVHIDTPGCRITVRPEDLPLIPPPRPREIRGWSRRDIYEWVSQSPNTPVVPITPQVDRRGRVIKPRTRYCPEDEVQRERELRQRARQKLQENNKADKAEANFQAQGITLIQGTSRTLSLLEESDSRYSTKNTGTRPKTKTESEVVDPSETPVSRKTRKEKPASVTSKKSKKSRDTGYKGWE
jgi:hypothetical protein